VLRLGFISGQELKKRKGTFPREDVEVGLVKDAPLRVRINASGG